MSDNTRIEWADATFNPWIGCTKVSAACDHCYAEKWDAHWGHSWGPHIRRRTSAANWRKPLAWDRAAAQAGKRIRVFCASLSDVFDNDRSITSGWRGDLWHLIHRTPNLDWMLLTKRPQNIALYLRPEEYGDLPEWGGGWPNVWLGTSAGTQKTADQNIPHLLDVPAVVHFVSAEPLLEPVDMLEWMHDQDCAFRCIDGECTCGAESGTGPHERCIDWIIVGGESGPNARPMHPEWARDVRDQCVAAGVAFFMKQWGAWITPEQSDPYKIGDPPSGDAIKWLREDGLVSDRPVSALTPGGLDPDEGETRIIGGEEVTIYPDHQWLPAAQVGKSRAGRLLDGREWSEVPR